MLSFIARQCYNKPVQGIISVGVWQNRTFVFGALRWRWQFPEQDSQTPTEGFVMSKEIPLTKDKVAIVDDEDYEYLMQWKWGGHERGYAQRYGKRSREGRKVVLMHRVIVERMRGAPIPEGLQVDHIDRDTSNNQRGNLRLATIQENARNRAGRQNTISQYKGVAWHKHKRKWIASIKDHGKSQHLGYFASEEEAGRAYDARARELFGEFALLNFPDKETGE